MHEFLKFNHACNKINSTQFLVSVKKKKKKGTDLENKTPIICPKCNYICQLVAITSTEVPSEKEKQ
jgi:hypothetical protein